MCDMGHDHHGEKFGFLVNTPEIRALIDEAERVRYAIPDDAGRVEALRPAFARLLRAEGWLPDELARPDEKSQMGGGIAQYALYRADDGSLCLFSLVIPAGASTPVHDHLAWGIVGVYRGRQDETIYERLDDGRDSGKAQLRLATKRTVDVGEFYTLLPPAEDIHFVRTVSDTPSISIHLLANDTACVWRHKYAPASGAVTPFRSGYANAPCPSEAHA